MLLVETLTLGDYQTNCYLVHAEGAPGCAIIDPGYTPEAVLSRVGELGLRVDAVLLTHGHFDHVGGVAGIAEATHCPLYVSPLDCRPSKNFFLRQLYPLSGQEIPGTVPIADGSELLAGGAQITVLATPGHTPGSVCFFSDDALFSGDTLFCGACGRTDLPGGSSKDMAASLARLAAIEKELRVFPGHGESTTLAYEKRYNPYLQASEDML